MLNKIMKAMVRSPEGDIDFTGVLQGNTLSTYIYNLLRTSMDLIKENGFTLKKEKVNDIQQRLTDAIYADKALFTNTPGETEFLL